MEMRAPEGGLPTWWWWFGKISKTSFSEMVFSRVKCRLSTKKNSSGKFFEMKIAHPASTLWREMHCDPFRWFLSSAFFFGHIIVFCQCGWRLKMCSKILSRSKVGSFWPWNHTEQWISQPIFAGPQSPLDDCSTIFEIFIELPIFHSIRAICTLLRGQNQLLIHLGEEKKPSKIS